MLPAGFVSRSVSEIPLTIKDRLSPVFRGIGLILRSGLVVAGNKPLIARGSPQAIKTSQCGFPGFQIHCPIGGYFFRNGRVFSMCCDSSLSHFSANAEVLNNIKRPMGTVFFNYRHLESFKFMGFKWAYRQTIPAVGSTTK